MSDVVQGYVQLFQGNTSAIGTEAGGCHRFTPHSNGAFNQAISGHLHGALEPIGVYPMVQYLAAPDHEPSWVVHWGCIDFDSGIADSWVHAKNVHMLLNALGITSWLERSRSKGYHVWVFAQEWVPAQLMREALLGACQVVEAPTKEINPKSIELEVGQLGNYVRLAYPGALSQLDARESRLAGGPHGGRGIVLLGEDGRPALHAGSSGHDRQGRRPEGEGHSWGGQCAHCHRVHEWPQAGVPLPSREAGGRSGPDVGLVSVDGPAATSEDPRVPRRVAFSAESGAPICLACFVSQALASRVSVEQLERLQQMYTPPAPPIVRRDWSGIEFSGNALERLHGKARIIFENGPLEGGDRSEALWKLACYLHEDGKHTPEEAFELLVDYDARWGKFAHRPDRDKRLQELVDKAWSR